MNNYHYLLKLILVGDSCAGKSCLLFQFANSSFKKDHDATLGVEFENKNLIINDVTLRLQLWDTAGSEAYQSITRSYYRGSICAIVVFDVTSRDSFESLQVWAEEINYVNNSNTILKAIVANKIDLVAERKISTEEAQAFAKNNQFAYFETSAKTGENVNNLFESIAKTILDKIISKEIDPYQEQYGIKVGSLVLQQQQALKQNEQIPQQDMQNDMQYPQQDMQYPQQDIQYQQQDYQIQKPQSLNGNTAMQNKKVKNKENGCC